MKTGKRKGKAGRKKEKDTSGMMETSGGMGDRKEKWIKKLQEDRKMKSERRKGNKGALKCKRRVEEKGEGGMKEKKREKWEFGIYPPPKEEEKGKIRKRE